MEITIGGGGKLVSRLSKNTPSGRIDSDSFKSLKSLPDDRLAAESIQFTRVDSVVHSSRFLHEQASFCIQSKHSDLKFTASSEL